MPPYTTTESTANGALQQLPAQIKLQSTTAATTTATSATNSAAAAATTGNQWWSLRTHPPPPTGTAATLCSLAWLAWAVAVIGGCALLFHLPPWQYAAFVTAAFALSAAIPDPGTAPWPTYAHLCLPIIAAKGLHAGGAWACSLIYWAFVLLPVLDALVGVDTFNHARAVYATLAERRAFRVTTCIFPLVEVALLLWSFREVATRELTVAEAVGYSVSVGVYAGGFGILIAHELLHRNTKFERLLGRIIIALMCYGHFNVEHNHGHHRTVATPEDPATARFGESFWSFLPRCVVNSFRSAVTIENARLRAEGLPWHHNEVYRYGVVSATVAVLVAALFGRAALYMFLGQSLMGIILFESVNYLEHYGLERREVSPGKYESVGVEHSWDSPFRLSNMCLFKLQRHADHHIAAGKRYQLLLAQKDAPQLPCGYPGSILLAFVPPAWFRVMDPRIHALRARHPGRVWRFGPACDGVSAAGSSAAGDSAAGGYAAGAPVQKSKDA